MLFGVRKKVRRCMVDLSTEISLFVVDAKLLVNSIPFKMLPDNPSGNRPKGSFCRPDTFQPILDSYL